MIAEGRGLSSDDVSARKYLARRRVADLHGMHKRLSALIGEDVPDVHQTLPSSSEPQSGEPAASGFNSSKPGPSEGTACAGSSKAASGISSPTLAKLGKVGTRLTLQAAQVAEYIAEETADYSGFTLEGYAASLKEVEELLDGLYAEILEAEGGLDSPYIKKLSSPYVRLGLVLASTAGTCVKKSTMTPSPPRTESFPQAQ